MGGGLPFPARSESSSRRLAAGAPPGRPPPFPDGGARAADEAVAPGFKEAPRPAGSARKAGEVLPEIEKLVLSPWKGDFDQMVGRRAVRALVAYSKGLYFVDGPRAHGVTYDMLKQFERYLNKKLDTGPRPIHVVFCAVRRDEMLPALLAGKGDVAAGNLSITRMVGPGGLFRALPDGREGLRVTRGRRADAGAPRGPLRPGGHAGNSSYASACASSTRRGVSGAGAGRLVPATRTSRRGHLRWSPPAHRNHVVTSPTGVLGRIFDTSRSARHRRRER